MVDWMQLFLIEIFSERCVGWLCRGCDNRVWLIGFFEEGVELDRRGISDYAWIHLIKVTIFNSPSFDSLLKFYVFDFYLHKIKFIEWNLITKWKLVSFSYNRALIDNFGSFFASEKLTRSSWGVIILKGKKNIKVESLVKN